MYAFASMPTVQSETSERDAAWKLQAELLQLPRPFLMTGARTLVPNGGSMMHPGYATAATVVPLSQSAIP